MCFKKLSLFVLAVMLLASCSQNGRLYGHLKKVNKRKSQEVVQPIPVQEAQVPTTPVEGEIAEAPVPQNTSTLSERYQQTFSHCRSKAKQVVLKTTRMGRDIFAAPSKLSRKWSDQRTSRRTDLGDALLVIFIILLLWGLCVALGITFFLIGILGAKQSSMIIAGSILLGIALIGLIWSFAI